MDVNCRSIPIAPGPWCAGLPQSQACLAVCALSFNLSGGICHHQLEMHHWLHFTSSANFLFALPQAKANHNRLRATTIDRRGLLRLSLRCQRHLSTGHIYSRSTVTARTDVTTRPRRQRNSSSVILTANLNGESVSLSGMCHFRVNINSSG